MTRFHGKNVVSCEFIRGTSGNPIIGSNLPPNTLAHINDIDNTLERFRGQYPILMGDINVDLDEAQNPRSHLVADMLMEFVLINLIHNFQKCHRLCC